MVVYLQHLGNCNCNRRFRLTGGGLGWREIKTRELDRVVLVARGLRLVSLLQFHTQVWFNCAFHFLLCTC